jgi:membrane protease YdiL (CAAX protease family)/uncharacterized RDD family membrane protein YckC
LSPEEFIAPAPAAQRSVEYASFTRRLGAALLDSLVWIIGIAFFNPGAAVWENQTAAAIVSVVILSAWFNYFAFCEWRWGQTIGKNATGIRVLPLEGGALTWQAAALRNLLRLVDLPLAMIGADYLIVRSSPRRQRVGDRAAKTIVVRDPAPVEAPPPAQHVGVGSSPPKPPYGGIAAPTAAEIFGESAEALGRQPAAGSAPRREGEPPAAPPPGRPADERVSSWTASGFPYSTWDLRRTLLGVLVGLLVGGLFAPLLVLPFDPDLSSTGALLVAQFLLEATLIVTAIGVASGATKAESSVREDLPLLGVRRFRPSAFGWMALGMVSYYTAAVAYALLVTEPEQKDVARDLGLNAGFLAAVPVVLLIVVVVPIAEEIFFRGMLFGGLRRRLSRLPAAAISALVFGGLHATTGVTAVPPLIIFGFILALLYERTGSLVPGMIAHGLNNGLALLATS